MQPAMNFLTTPAQCPRGNEVLATPTGPDGSHSGAAFAGVLNGQMLKLERQALAAPPAAADDLQVLRLGNKLNVITTDAPLPDIASLAQFARAQGLGESAVQALFGSAASLVAVPTPGELGITVGISGAGLTSALGQDSAAQAAALAQAAVQALTAGATSQTGISLQSSEANNGASLQSSEANNGASLQASLANSGISLQALVTNTGVNTLSTAASAESNSAMAGQKDAEMRTLALEDGVKLGNIAANTQILNAASADTQILDAASAETQILNAASGEALNDRNETKTALADKKISISGASPLEAFLAERALLGMVKIQAPTPVDKGPAKTQIAFQSEADLVLAAAVQAGLGMVPQASPSNDVIGEDPVIDPDQAVSIRYLSIQNGGIPPAALALSTLRAESLTQLGQTEVNPQTNALSAAETQATTQTADAGNEAQAALQLRLVPPDQAITKRLALIAGTEKPIDWSALLAGQKVSDTLSGLAQSSAPVLSDAQAKLIAQMQANGQLPPSADEARNALLAKVQAQAAKMGTFGVPALNAQATATATATAPVPVPVASNSPKATAMTQGALLAGLHDSKLLQISNPAQNAAAMLAPPPGPAQGAAPGQTHSLWENLRIEVPSGLALEALQASKSQRSDAEPELHMGPGTAQANGPAAAPAAAKAEAATPQALAEQRAAQYQQVADQMGEAMARRLMAQIERGQWKMQLRMQPSALGRIEVELNMHKSGLDATFSADNAVTRELMAQGSARLRDTLTQSGTTVASVVVNGDSGRQSGGNSTPGQKSKDEQSASSKKSVAATVATVATRAPVDQGDGLNVLA